MLVPLRINAKDMAIRTKARAAGGRWNPEKQLWYVSYGNVVGNVDYVGYVMYAGYEDFPASNKLK